MIEISSDEPEPSPPRDKPSSSTSSVAGKKVPPSPQIFRARKSTGGGPKPKSKPPEDTEYILISSDDEPEPPSRQSNQGKAPSAQGGIASSKRISEDSDSDDAMMAEHEAVAASLASPDMEVDEPELGHAQPTSTIVSSPVRTNASTSNKPESHSPKTSLQESPTTKIPPMIRSPVKKPVLNRHGANDISVPSGKMPAPSQRQKSGVQFAVKSASMGKRKVPSSSSGSDSSDSLKESTSRESEDQPRHDGMDMRHLSDALNAEAESTKPQPLKQVPQPAPPVVERAVPPPLRKAKPVSVLQS